MKDRKKPFFEVFQFLKDIDYMAGVKGGVYSAALAGLSSVPPLSPAEEIAVPAGPRGEEIELTEEDEEILDRAWDAIAKRERGK